MRATHKPENSAEPINWLEQSEGVKGLGGVGRKIRRGKVGTDGTKNHVEVYRAAMLARGDVEACNFKNCERIRIGLVDQRRKGCNGRSDRIWHGRGELAAKR